MSNNQILMRATYSAKYRTPASFLRMPFFGITQLWLVLTYARPGSGLFGANCKDMPRVRQNTAISYFFGSQGQWCSSVFVSTTPMTQEVFSWAGYALQGAKYKERHCGISDTFSQFDFRTKSSVFGWRSFLHLLRILKLWSELKCLSS